MVAKLVALKWALFKNGLKRSKWQVVGIIFGALYALSVVSVAITAMVAVGRDYPEAVPTGWILLGSAMILGWIIIPVFVTGVDLTLDPARFATFGIPMNKLVPGLVLSSFVGIPGIAMILVTLIGQPVAYAQLSPAAALVSPIAAVLGLLTCIVASRLATTAAAQLMNSRRFKDVSQIILFLPLVLLGPIIAGIVAAATSNPAFLVDLAQVLAWTPLGAPWAIPAAIAAGNPGQAALVSLIAVVFLLALAWLWSRMLSRALENPPVNAVTKRAAGKLGWFARFPATPTGAVAARATTYWFRDPRYSISLFMLPLFAILLWFWGSGGGRGEALPGIGLYWMLGAIVAYFVGYGIIADISFDNTAFALHVSTGVSGRADRAGRVLGAATIGLPLMLLAWIVPPLITGDWSKIVLSVGVSLGLLGIALGVSSVVSARYTYNTPLPGDSPFKTPPGTGARAAITSLASTLAVGILGLPLIIPTVVALMSGQMMWQWIVLAVGLLWGSAVLWFGIRTGGASYDRRAPELLASVALNR